MNKNTNNILDLKQCPVCGERTEAPYPDNFPFPMKKHHIPCRCERERNKRILADQKEREHSFKVSRYRSLRFSSPRMYGITFSKAKNDGEGFSVAKNYAKNWEQMKEDNQGLLFWGNTGSGKTFLAICIANELIEKEVSVKMTNTPSIINEVFNRRDKNTFINELCRHELLIIDGIGAERSTEYALENLFLVIDARYRTGRPLIITTNIPLHELQNAESAEYQRIYGRILEMCRPVRVAGANRRTTIAEEQMERILPIVLPD